MVVRDGRKLGTPFLDIRGQVTAGSEQGLLSLAFAPDYAASGLFYVYFTDEAGDQRIVEYRRRDADRADPGSARLVLRMADSESNHNGGLLLFGPDDLLYVGTGDGGGGGDQHGARGNGQDLGSLLGKILRIDPRASGGRAYRSRRATRSSVVPARAARSTPTVCATRGASRSTASTATCRSATSARTRSRRSTSCGAARAAGRTSAGGRSRAASRYAEGEPAPGHVLPVIVRAHSDGNCSITGGVVVRDPRAARAARALRLRRLLQGPDRVGAAVAPAARAASARTSLRVDSLSSFGEDAEGRVYATSLDGPVYRIVAR